MDNRPLSLTDLLDIKYPIIMAPMFLVSNTNMIIAGIKAGITGAIPAMNYRTTEDLRTAIQTIKKEVDGPFGINLIVNASNFLYKEQLEICCQEKIAFIITSLGSPAYVIERAHAVGIKVFCDVTDKNYAQKVEKLGADAVIAVNKEAGGHAGKISYNKLIPELLNTCKIPVISAGGIGCSEEYKKILQLGVAGVSIGSIFIASLESEVSDEYKQACVDYGAKDIVLSTKLSGTPCTVIKTPYVEKIGTSQNFLERLLNKNKRFKKWFKALTFYRGMKSLEKAAFSATYKTVWCAGPSIEHVNSIDSINQIISNLMRKD
jgi:nitronate monooxygenase